MPQFFVRLQEGVLALRQLPVDYPEAFAWYTLILRLVFPLLALALLVRIIRSLVKVSPKPEVWAYLSLPNGASVPLTHWENILGRADSCDVVLNYPVVSRQHAALIRNADESWTVYDLGSKSGVTVNGSTAAPTGTEVAFGDVLGMGGVETVLLPVSDEETRHRREMDSKPVSPWVPLVLLTLFQVLTALQFLLSVDEAHLLVPCSFLLLAAVMWLYCAAMRSLGRIGFEIETVAFFLSTLSLAVTASSAPAAVPKQLLAMVLGLIFFLVLGLFLRELERVKKIRWLMAAGAIGLLSLSLVAGHVKYGAANWISIGGVSFQPSELAKVCYIFAGAATLDRLFRKRNLGLFIVLTGVCMGCLALMSDFGTAAIFFVTFLVIAYLRSGDFATLSLICGGAVPGGGWLHRIPAADTDLVFGMLCEEWGLIIAVLSVLCIVALAVFAVRCCQAGRSSFYTIAACAATSLLVFQTTLNVLGCVDILPLTGVTFPFVSNGGSSMLSSWGMMAFLKAADTRSDASFAIRRSKLHSPQWLGNLAAPRKEVPREED